MTYHENRAAFDEIIKVLYSEGYGTLIDALLDNKGMTKIGRLNISGLARILSLSPSETNRLIEKMRERFEKLGFDKNEF